MNKWKVSFFITLILLVGCITISAYITVIYFSDLQSYERYIGDYEEDIKSINLAVQNKAKVEIRKELNKSDTYYLETDSSISLNNIILIFDKDSLLNRIDKKKGSVSVKVIVRN